MSEVIAEKIDDKRSRGRQRIGMLEKLKEGSYQQMKRRAKNLSDENVMYIGGPVNRAEHL